jgi:cellulose synthase/poly-beta-1,6-N-acetylglucosamine synthase-like glycosyltransferase
MKPNISIIIEWENYILADMGRSLSMLQRLKQQIPILGRPVELIVLFNPGQIDRFALETEIYKILEVNAESALLVLRVEEVSGKHYYELKNEGVKLANGEIIVFVDSDVIPEDGWLVNIVRPFFDNTGIKVLAGNSYIDYEDVYSKAFALSWFFDLRVQEQDIGIRNAGFYANNVAFRKEVITEFPFPKMPDGVTRGSCYMLYKQLESAGISVWTNTAAQVSHPAPNGFSHFYTRALAEGRDHFLTDQPAFLDFFRNSYVERIRRSFKRIIRDREKVNLSLWQAPVAIGIMTAYYSLYLIGGFIALLMPGYAKASWKI